MINVNNSRTTNTLIAKIDNVNIGISNNIGINISDSNIVYALDPYKYNISSQIPLSVIIDHHVLLSETDKPIAFTIKSSQSFLPIVKNDVKLFENNITYIDIPRNLIVDPINAGVLKIQDDHTIEIFCIIPTTSMDMSLFEITSQSLNSAGKQNRMSFCGFPEGNAVTYDVYGGWQSNTRLRKLILLPLNTLCHGIFRFSRNETIPQRTIIVNGIEIINSGADRSTPFIGDWNGLFSLFSEVTGSNAWYGKLLSFKIYNIALSNQQIMNNYFDFIEFASINNTTANLQSYPTTTTTTTTSSTTSSTTLSPSTTSSTSSISTTSSTTSSPSTTSSISTTSLPSTSSTTIIPTTSTTTTTMMPTTIATTMQLYTILLNNSINANNASSTNTLLDVVNITRTNTINLNMSVQDIMNITIPSINIVYALEPYKYRISSTITLSNITDHHPLSSSVDKPIVMTYTITGFPSTSNPTITNDIILFGKNITNLNVPISFSVNSIGASILNITDDYTVEIISLISVALTTTLYTITSNSLDSNGAPVRMSLCHFPLANYIHYDTYGCCDSTTRISALYDVTKKICHTVFRFSRNGTVQRSIIINGVVVASSGTTRTTPNVGDWNGKFRLFSEEGNANPWKGKILSFRIYNIALSDAQIMSNYYNFVNFVSNYDPTKLPTYPI